MLGSSETLCCLGLLWTCLIQHHWLSRTNSEMFSATNKYHHKSVWTVDETCFNMCHTVNTAIWIPLMSRTNQKNVNKWWHVVWWLGNFKFVVLILLSRSGIDQTILCNIRFQFLLAEHECFDRFIYIVSILILINVSMALDHQANKKLNSKQVNPQRGIFVSTDLCLVWLAVSHTKFTCWTDRRNSVNIISVCSTVMSVTSETVAVGWYNVHLKH